MDTRFKIYEQLEDLKINGTIINISEKLNGNYTETRITGRNKKKVYLEISRGGMYFLKLGGKYKLREFAYQEPEQSEILVTHFQIIKDYLENRYFETQCCYKGKLVQESIFLESSKFTLVNSLNWRSHFQFLFKTEDAVIYPFKTPIK